jgi:hypothetical protein
VRVPLLRGRDEDARDDDEREPADRRRDVGPVGGAVDDGSERGREQDRLRDDEPGGRGA